MADHLVHASRRRDHDHHWVDWRSRRVQLQGQQQLIKDYFNYYTVTD